MKNALKIFIFLTLIVVSNHSFSQAGWTILSESNSVVTSGNFYYLQDLIEKYHLKYEERKYGINLAWGKRSNPNIKFVKSEGGEIKCGDKVAIYVENGKDKFLKYQKREHGINLVWSKEPVYEWELRSKDNQKGSPINTNEEIGIYNEVEDDFMKYCVRVKPVINLAWSKDCCDGYRVKCEYDKWKPMVIKAIKYGGPLILAL